MGKTSVLVFECALKDQYYLDRRHKDKVNQAKIQRQKKKKIQGGIGAGGDPRKVNKKFALKCEREK